MKKINLFHNFLNYGHEQTLVFVHGGPGANSSLFFGYYQDQKLYEKFNILVIDQPGCGLSPRLDDSTEYDWDVLTQSFADVLKKYPKLKLALVAESFGCMLVLELFKRTQLENIEKVVLVGPAVTMVSAKKDIVMESLSINEQIVTFVKALDQSQSLSKQLETANSEVKNYFLNKIKKYEFRALSTKPYLLAKDLIPTELKPEAGEWTRDFFSFFYGKTHTGELKDLMSKRLEEEKILLKSFLLKIENMSLREIKEVSKMYSTFFYNQNTFEYVAKCRELAGGVESLYSIENMDFSNNVLTEVMENKEKIHNYQLSIKDIDIQVPLVVMRGEKDLYVNKKDIDNLYSKKNKNREIVFRHCGHCPIYERPEDFKKILEEELCKAI